MNVERFNPYSLKQKKSISTAIRLAAKSNYINFKVAGCLKGWKLPFGTGQKYYSYSLAADAAPLPSKQKMTVMRSDGHRNLLTS